MEFFHLSPGVLLAALLFGALHALEPGHGKTALVVYMADGRKSVSHSLLIGFASFFSHTASILMISFVVHAATHAAGKILSAESVTWYVSFCSSVVLLGLGGFLLLRSFRNARKQSHEGCCGHDHSEDFNQGHRMSHRAKFSLSALIGVSVGLYPCPTAIAAYLTALSQGNHVGGYTSIEVYGIGIGLTMSVIAVGSGYLGRSFLSRMRKSITPSLILRIQAGVFILIGFGQLLHVHP